MARIGANSGRKEGVTDEMIIKLYKDKVPYKEMIAITGLTTGGILYVLKKNGVDTSKGKSRKRKYKVNEDFFKVWSHEMAWTLGMFITDGCVSPNQSITFAQKDTRILTVIAKYLQTESPIKGPSSTSSSSILIINSKEMKQDLANMGITENKSLIVPFPNVPEEYLPSFVRGVIDGDGHVSKDGYFATVTTGSEEFSNKLLELFKSWEINTYIRKEISRKGKNKKGHGNPVYRVVVSGKDSLSMLSEIIYSNCTDDCVFHKRDKMSQHRTGIKYPCEDSKIVYGFRANEEIFKEILVIVKQENLYFNSLVENGLTNMLKNKPIIHKVKRNRSDFKIFMDKELLDQIRQFAKEQNIFIGQAFEECVNYINIQEIKNQNQEKRLSN